MASIKVLIICLAIAFASATKQKKYLKLVELTCENDGFLMKVQPDTGYPAAAFLTLNDKSCSFDPTKSTYTAAYSKCGTTVEVTKEFLIYRNKIRYTDISMNDPSATVKRSGLTEIVVLECKRTRRSVKALIDAFKPGYSVVEVTESRLGTFSVALELYKDDAFKDGYGKEDYPVEVTIQDAMNLQLGLDSALDDISIVPQSCYATVTNNPDDQYRHYLFKDRCPSDTTFKLVKTADKTFQYQIESFDLVKENDGVFLHCETVVCQKGSDEEHCKFGCPKPQIADKEARKRRSVDEKTEKKTEKFDYITVSSGFITTRSRDQLLGEQQKACGNIMSNGTTKAVLSGLIVVVLVLIIAVGFLFCRAKNRFIFAGQNQHKLELLSQS